MKPTKLIKRSFRVVGLFILAASLTGCIYWLRAYQTYLQMSEFDRYFKVAVTDQFTLQFNDPKMYSEDFIALAKLYPSEDNLIKDGRSWRYWFRKVDKDNHLVKPDIKFYSDMAFNAEKKLTAWSFSSLFLQIAPPAFLEVSLRSIAGGEIDKENQSLKANTDLVGKINAALPKKSEVLAKLGEPLSIQDEPGQEVYLYRFLLDTPRIEEGYEKNALNEVKLSFDKKNQELIIMAGNFAGLKVSIDYRKFLKVAQ
ncbi:MAG: hypothetical protein PHH59_12765 [Methylovulum sp.]|uniref:hypothetical protein n=1 Tax=Methylovulum sp. TaxID=1916980 RepID=UPI0026116EBB|nr:hypothetical protein [Methylovulum sp.]MDD2724879.1 hypothetical protein [Methylovulum sp.]MDD5126297.1 hypothetical protein [Methylovulum sp.]